MTGASRGLGAALATDLMERDFSVAVCATATPVLVGALCRSVDVADHQAVEVFAADVVEQLGAVDLWINNAAVIGPVGLVRDVDPAEWAECVQVNIMGTVHGSRAFLSRCSASGVLLNVASRAGVTGVAGLSAYSATKASVIAFTQSLTAEMSGVSAFVVVPPSVDTDMQRGLLSQDESVFPGVVDSRNRRDTGAILGARDAARAILGSVLDGQPASTVIDLSC